MCSLVITVTTGRKGRGPGLLMVYKTSLSFPFLGDLSVNNIVIRKTFPQQLVKRMSCRATGLLCGLTPF